MASKYVGARMSDDERRKIKQLARQAGTTPSEILRALVRSAVIVHPAKPAKVTIKPPEWEVQCETA